MLKIIQEYAKGASYRAIEPNFAEVHIDDGKNIVLSISPAPGGPAAFTFWSECVNKKTYHSFNEMALAVIGSKKNLTLRVSSCRKLAWLTDNDEVEVAEIFGSSDIFDEYWDIKSSFGHEIPIDDDERKQRKEVLLDTSIESIGLKKQVKNKLIGSDIKTVGQLTEMKELDILKIWDLGTSAVADIKRCLGGLGLRLSN